MVKPSKEGLERLARLRPSMRAVFIGYSDHGNDVIRIVIDNRNKVEEHKATFWEPA